MTPHTANIHSTYDNGNEQLLFSNKSFIFCGVLFISTSFFIVQNKCLRTTGVYVLPSFIYVYALK